MNTIAVTVSRIRLRGSVSMTFVERDKKMWSGTTVNANKKISDFWDPGVKKE
jgi:hypothetical protein